jgi:nitroimidazol reductase NimA-like FMN-containing flavoprotein (pyridoxamine 5'-phosphate oxidase superfamily)
MQKSSTLTSAPKVSRPQIPDIYGLPKHNKGLLPWSHVGERMAQARVYWVTTVDPSCNPHATPVDGVWLDDRLYFGGSQETRRNRNLARNPAVCVHLESGSDVVILFGEVQEFNGEDHQLSQRLADASNEKYGYGSKPEDYAVGGTFAFSPRKVIAWKTLFKDATRWEF